MPFFQWYIQAGFVIRLRDLFIETFGFGLWIKRMYGDRAYRFRYF